MMKLSKQMIDIIKESLSNKTLTEGEIRRINEVGNLYMTKKRLHPENEESTVINGFEYWFQYALRIDGVTYYFHGGIPAVEEK